MHAPIFKGRPFLALFVSVVHLLIHYTFYYYQPTFVMPSLRYRPLMTAEKDAGHMSELHELRSKLIEVSV